MKNFILKINRSLAAKKTKLFTLFLALAASIGMVNASVEIDGIAYNLNETELTAEVTSKSPEYSGEVIIPSSVTYNGTTYSVTSIGDYAFYGCDKTTSVTIGNSVTNIGEDAFSFCSGLTSITIPNSVRNIGGYAFRECTGLTNVHISDIAAWCGITFSSYCSNPLYHAHHLYLNDIEITDLVLPNSVTSIEDYAFRNCSSLTSVTIPNSVTSIGDEAFCGCTGLTSLTIPNSVRNIEDYAFSFCSGLTSITIPSSVTIIGDDAFRECTGLRSVTFEDGVTSIGKSAFYWCTGLTSITIPNSVTSIGNSAFSGCDGLTSVTIGNGVTSIGMEAFYGCDNLKTMTIGNSVTSIGKDAVHGGGTDLTKVILNSDSLVNKNYNLMTFENNILSIFGMQVEDYVIGDGVTRIGRGALGSRLDDMRLYYSSVTIGRNVKSIGTGAFYNARNLMVVYIEDLASWCGIVFEGVASNPVNSVCGTYVRGLNFDIENLVIPDGVPCIEKEVFQGVREIESVTIPNSVTSIGDWAFNNCPGLKSVEIGSGVTSIGERAFGYCTSLSEMTCEVPTPPSLGDNVFYNTPTTSCILYVPKESINLYRTADVWKDFGNILPLEARPTITLRLDPNSCSNWESVYLWAWTSKGDIFSSWPGISVNKDADGWYSYTFDTSIQSVNIIWTDGNNQTVDIENVTTSTCYRLNSTSGNKIDVTVIDCAASEIPYYTVTFQDWNGTILKTEQVGEGYSATAPANPTRSGYMFTGWDKDFTNIQSDLIVTAQYVQNANGAGITVRLDPQSCANWETVYLWAWTSEGNWFATWPGTVVNQDTDGWYAYTFAENIDNVNILWSDGTNQTVDITNVSESTCYALNSTTGTTITVTVVDCPTVTNPDSVLYPDSVSYVRIELIGEETTKTKSRAFKLSGSKDNFSQDVTGSAYYSIKSNEIVTYNGFTGYKFNDSGQHIGLTFPKGKLQTGDVVNVYITKISGSVGDGYLHFFSDYGVTELVDVKENHGPGVYSFTLGDNASELEAIYLFRRQKGSTKDMNPYVAYMEIVRGIALPTQVVITIEPGSTFADIAWPQVTGAATYELVIQNQDGSIVCTLIFNAQGQLVSITFNTIKRNNAPQQTQTTGFSYTIDGLESNTTYNYTLTAKDEMGNILYTQSGTFTTTASQGIDEIHSSSTLKKVIINGQLFIQKGDKTYTLQGQEIK